MISTSLLNQLNMKQQEGPTTGESSTANAVSVLLLRSNNRSHVPAEISSVRVLNKELKIEASLMMEVEVDYRTSIGLVSNGRMSARAMIDHRTSLEQIRHALELSE
jgi:threonine dehydrogenase-like Zn-dependent dehydrogenase